VGAWKMREDSQIKIYSANMEDYWETSWEKLASNSVESWKKYVAGAILLFQKDQLATSPAPKGFELSLKGNIPLGKGLSSSAAIELCILNGLGLLYKKTLSSEKIAKMAQQVEHQYLKVKSGLLDQFACQFSKKGSALLIDFSNLSTTPAPTAPSFESFSWVLVDSLVKRELSNSKYSERVEEYEFIKTFLNEKNIASIRDVASSDVPALFANMKENIIKRARHITSENERTQQACAALASGNIEQLGDLLYKTHKSLSEDYEVSHKNLDFLVEAAKSIPGVVGGRMMGGGFGGCALFLVHNDAIENFSSTIAQKYFDHTQLSTSPRSYRFVAGASAWTANAH
jgi:galactokinase